MKYLAIFLFIFLASCTRDTYEVYVEYQDGTKDTLRYRAYTYPSLDDGCIEFNTENDAVRCGVKAFTYKIIDNEPKGVH